MQQWTRQYCFEELKSWTKFCRNSFKNGGVCIFIQEIIHFTNVSLLKVCKEKDLEICAVKLYLAAYTIYIKAIYRSPSRNCQQFLNNLKSILNFIYSNSIKIIICVSALFMPSSGTNLGSKRKYRDVLLLCAFPYVTLRCDMLYCSSGTNWFC
jgi:hypothetical protein